MYYLISVINKSCDLSVIHSPKKKQKKGSQRSKVIRTK